MNWERTKDKLPNYDEPVLISIKGVTQNITYELICRGCELNYFKPVYFGDDIDGTLWPEMVDSWMYLPQDESFNITQKTGYISQLRKQQDK